MTRPAAVLVAVLLATAAGCGGGSEQADLRRTCAQVREAFPATIYDDQDNAAFARRLDRILQGAEEPAREAMAPLDAALDEVVDARGDNQAVVTANVDLLAAIEKVDERCRDAGAKPVH